MKNITISADFRKNTIKAVLSIGLFIITYLALIAATIGLTIGLCYLGIGLVSLKASGITFMLALALASIGFLIMFFLVKFIFSQKKTDWSHLTEIKRSDEPRLFDLIQEVVNETGTQFPKKVYVSTEVNASVFYNSSFWSMFFPVKKNLHIGAGLMNAVTVDEFKGILAHEFGHFSQRSMKVGSYVHNVNQIIHDMLYDNQSYESMITSWANISGYFSFATAKKNQLMVNQFQDERSQNVYMVIDKGRVMKMPFNGLSLLDYAINSTLVLSNIILKKQDKAGMFTFSKKVENRVAAERRSSQMQRILETLYNVKTNFFESDFGRLYGDIKKNVNQRSLILLYTNFETVDSLKRQLPYLKGIAHNHLLVVVFFENSELDQLINGKVKNVQEVYDQVIAEKLAFEKRLIVNELKKYGIHSVLTKPENLTIESINKYLEIKARGIL